SMRSIGTGMADLNVDTRTSMQNSALALEAERDRLWQDFYNKRSETYTQLGNTLGQQADYYVSAEENDVSSGGKRQAAKTSSEEAFMNAARETGRSYQQQGVPQWLQEWKGIEAPQARQANTDLAAAVKFEPLGAPEGASLRGW
ncbi:MAG TPA: hypothetical protein VFT95_03650, partial [Micromonosporaceae bacterium]|nr:hypothetical protein [Micromonosporaceae bacterium]